MNPIRAPEPAAAYSRRRGAPPDIQPCNVSSQPSSSGVRTAFGSANGEKNATAGSDAATRAIPVDQRRSVPRIRRANRYASGKKLLE